MNKNPGKVVLIKGGRKGRTFNSKELINGKVQVFLEQDGKPFVFHDNAVLCQAKNMTIIGHID